ncbi:hypothetical protein [Paradevosia shaoguanensis]|jgi:hypothetical protein|uniref:Uncharacterized protein n=1 Tax=Paradevosia shaoguanensis TaxID=1335043 RepID=A0AA41UA53_9HYPH|nr:hypothetical protein [Paradevosia shaoguanensis]KFL27704.1 hypothetical protein JP74_06425 [Devosia sp. 17-2-E-8]MCF1741572.1 hypothetical protein [Paradevosia shaoguanensis]MCI0126055.1 hypothetical protein [Paradevosia shaoguanensis]
MSIHQVKAHSLVPAVPRREPEAAQGWFARLVAWWGRQNPAVPDHLRADVGLPPREPSMFDFPLVDLGRKADQGKSKDWMN